MKTHIIQINPGDDYLSIREKMDWSQARHILLVWPKHGRVLNRKLDLNLAQQHAISLGVQLALVTNDKQVRYFARELSIPVFTNLQQAHRTDWSIIQQKVFNPPRINQRTKLDELQRDLHAGTPTWLEQPVTRVLSLCISVVAIFFLVSFLLPGAKVTITPKEERQAMIFNVIGDPAAKMINYSTGSLPTFSLEAVVEGQESIPCSGSVLYPDQPARGKLSFSNMSGQDSSIPPGTIVSTKDDNPVRFITRQNQDITVEPGQTVELDAQAMNPGLSGNLAKNTLVVIEGTLGSNFSVTNPTSMRGGTQTSVAAVSLQDKDRLRARLVARLEQAALEAMQAKVGQGDWIITPTIKLIEPISEIYVPDVGEPGNTLSLSMQARFSAQVISNITLHRLVEPIMDSYTPEGYSTSANSLTFSQAEQPVLLENGKFNWVISATRVIRADIPASQVINRILGLPVAQASEHLSALLPLAEHAQINLTPDWWPRLPWLGMRIQVIVGENQ